MKKELLIASALVGSLGFAGLAEAASATMTGKHRVGMVSTDSDSATESRSNHEQSTFSVSISETTDSGVKISTGFDLAEEGDAYDPSGLTLTFTSGAKLDLISAGNAAASQLAAVPGASGEMGITGTSTVNAPGSLSYGDASDAVGFEFHTAADAFGVTGLKASASWSTNDDGAVTSSTHVLENAYSLGASYVSTAGDTTVTIGGGMFSVESHGAKVDGAVVSAFSVSAVNGNLTVGAGFASGDVNKTATTTTDGNTGIGYAIKGADYTQAGAKYVSGDMTFAIGYLSGTGNDGNTDTAAAGTDDKYQKTAASIDYVVASGVTATVGFSDEIREDDGAAVPAVSGTSWYIGANLSF
jgi:hypothetical protein